MVRKKQILGFLCVSVLVAGLAVAAPQGPKRDLEEGFGASSLRERLLPADEEGADLENGIPLGAMGGGAQGQDNNQNQMPKKELPEETINQLREGAKALMAKDPDFWAGLSAFNEYVYKNEALSPGKKRALTAISLVASTLAAGAIAEMFMYNRGIMPFLHDFDSVEDTFPGTASIVTGSLVAVFGLLNNHLDFRQMLDWVVHGRSEYLGLVQDNAWGRTLVENSITVPAVTILVGKTLFSYIHFYHLLDEKAREKLYYPIILFGVPWGIEVIKRGYGLVNRLSIRGFKLLRDTYHRHQGQLLLGEGARQHIRRALAAGFRKVLDEQAKEETLDLALSITAIQDFVREHKAKLQATIDQLKNIGKGPDKVADIHDREEKIVQLLDEIKAHERVGDLLIFRALYQFAQGKGDDKYQVEPAHGLKDWLKRCFVVPGEPKLVTAARNLCRTVGWMSVGSVWYGWTYIANTFGASVDDSYVAGGLMTLASAPGLAEAFATCGSQLVSRVLGYNPVTHKATITQPHIGLRGLRATMETLKYVHSILNAFPASIVGPQAMFIGFDGFLISKNSLYDQNGYAFIKKSALTTVIPSMIGYGSLEQEATNPPLQTWIAGVYKRFGHNPKLKLQQEVAALYARFDGQMETARGAFLLKLLEKLTCQQEMVLT